MSTSTNRVEGTPAAASQVTSGGSSSASSGIAHTSRPHFGPIVYDARVMDWSNRTDDATNRAQHGFDRAIDRFVGTAYPDRASERPKTLSASVSSAPKAEESEIQATDDTVTITDSKLGVTFKIFKITDKA